VLFGRELYIDADDFSEEPPPKFFRLAPGREVRLKGAYYVTCVGVERDAVTGKVLTVRCTHDPSSRGGGTPDGRVVRGTLHWVSAEQSVPAEVRLYDHLFRVADPEADADVEFTQHLNPDSRRTLHHCRVEAHLAVAAPGQQFQFLRHGYFVVDDTSTRDRPVFNRSVGLRDTWAKVKGGAA
jgi:glutaminyl-tRNA synthetase